MTDPTRPGDSDSSGTGSESSGPTGCTEGDTMVETCDAEGNDRLFTCNGEGTRFAGHSSAIESGDPSEAMRAWTSSAAAVSGPNAKSTESAAVSYAVAAASWSPSCS